MWTIWLASVWACLRKHNYINWSLGSEGRHFLISEINFLTKLSHKLGQFRLQKFTFLPRRRATVHSHNGKMYGEPLPDWTLDRPLDGKTLKHTCVYMHLVVTTTCCDAIGCFHVGDDDPVGLHLRLAWGHDPSFHENCGECRLHRSYLPCYLLLHLPRYLHFFGAHQGRQHANCKLKMHYCQWQNS